jgi:hypothetical protein
VNRVPDGDVRDADAAGDHPAETGGDVLLEDVGGGGGGGKEAADGAGRTEGDDFSATPSAGVARGAAVLLVPAAAVLAAVGGFCEAEEGLRACGGVREC